MNRNDSGSGFGRRPQNNFNQQRPDRRNDGGGDGGYAGASRPTARRPPKLVPCKIIIFGVWYDSRLTDKSRLLIPL